MITSNIAVNLIGYYGSDETVIQAAQVFVPQETERSPEKLMFYLAKGMRIEAFAEAVNRVIYLSNQGDVSGLVDELHALVNTPTHFAPFAHPQVTLRITAPLAIARQLWKSHVGAVGGDCGYPIWNELSFRKQRTLEMYAPEGSPATYTAALEVTEEAYETLLTEEVHPELARFVLPGATMTTWVWTGSLLFFAKLYNLRSRSDVQSEARTVMEAMSPLFADTFPLAWRALTSSCINGLGGLNPEGFITLPVES